MLTRVVQEFVHIDMPNQPSLHWRLERESERLQAACFFGKQPHNKKAVNSQTAVAQACHFSTSIQV